MSGRQLLAADDTAFRDAKMLQFPSSQSNSKRGPGSSRLFRDTPEWPVFALARKHFLFTKPRSIIRQRKQQQQPMPRDQGCLQCGLKGPGHSVVVSTYADAQLAKKPLTLARTYNLAHPCKNERPHDDQLRCQG